MRLTASGGDVSSGESEKNVPLPATAEWGFADLYNAWDPVSVKDLGGFQSMLHNGLSKDYILEQSWVAPIYLPPFLSSITFAAVSQSGPQALIQMVCNEPPPHPDMILCALMRSETRHLRTTRCLTATERTTHRSFGAVRNCGGAFPKLASEPPIILSCSRELPFFAFSDTCCATELSLLVIVVARKRRDCNKGSAR